MRVYLGSDHAGFALKAHLLRHLPTLGFEVTDCGAKVLTDGDDYPPYCIATAERVRDDPGSLGVVVGGSGNGEQIAANRVAGIRAALAWNEDTARLAREHNDAQIVAIGARMHPIPVATRLVEVFLATPFSQGARHVRRIGELRDYDAAHRTG